MKIWQTILLTILIVTMSALSACDLLGIGKSKAEKEQEYYQQQVDAYNKALEAYQKQREEYNERLQQGLEEWSKAYQEWEDRQLQQQLQQVDGMPSANQSSGSGSN